MRAQARWLDRADIAILEFFAEKEIDLPPKPIYVNINKTVDVSHEKTKRRCRILRDAGLLERSSEIRGGYYRISDAGRKWYRGDMSLEELEERRPPEA